ncbi:tol-pal system protein YbgF [Geoalkalibacter halelectricus]|uniref:Tol-pal system protein YbgF n=1 Tax=Geoalkalibacter halelectricus TaxID=2847045 RepID=A0ABY5ZFW7_9BACT|nr:tol-pal system protein YbgF [Geoalkalibacter halelectricus]MDO3378182.1 tol-pal system protein YbgF [Geoalkalibacter halelectricus]UWZ78027.1 tol-pal system protein YbgF [Geoalkalibacter halelectricus]
MKKLRTLIALLALSLLLGACLPSQSQLRLEQDQQELKRRLAELERHTLGRSQEQSQEMAGRIDVMARQQAENQAAMDALRVELQAINGRLEDSARSQAQFRDDLRLVRDDLGLKVSALEDRLAAMEGRGGAAAGVVGAVQPLAAPAVTPEALYQRGLDQIMRQNDFAAGRETLTQFLRQHPDHAMAINAQYWIGEAFYGEKRFENAILQFQDVIQQHGEHPKAAAAMLKQGLAFDALGDRGNARVIMEKVRESYPLSEEAKKAKEFLDQWS